MISAEFCCAHFSIRRFYWPQLGHNRETKPMRFMLFLLVVALSLTVPTFVSSQEGNQIDIRELSRRCGSQNDIERAFCLGYVSGVARQVKWNGLAYKDLTNLHDATIIAFMAACPSTVVSDEATLQVFKDWAKNHSDQGGSDAQLGVMNALVAMWPCNQQSK